MPGPIGVELLDAFAAGIYLFFGIVHLDLWLKRRDRPGHLWLAVAAGGALVVDLSGMVLRRFPMPSGILPVVNLLGVAVVTASLLGLVQSLGNRSVGVFTRAACGIGVILAILAGVGMEGMAPAFFLLCWALMLGAMVHAFRAGRGGDRESRALAGGLLVLLLSLMADVLGILGVIEAAPGLPVLGFAAMFLVSASSLNGRYEREHRELVALRHELEQRVMDRTRALEEANQRLDEASRTDSLTGLPNRRGFLDVADHELKRSARAGDPCSVLMVDLDHFKRVNDRYGHGAGDAVLQGSAAVLRNVLRAEDLVARWGGEEFIVMLPKTSGDVATAVADKVRLALEALSFDEHGVPETITASFGVATHAHGTPLDLTIAAADQALYDAKAAGRNRVMRSVETGT